MGRNVICRAFFVFFFAVMSVLSPIAKAQTCADLDGAYVKAQDGSGKYLGFFGSAFANESIMNSFGLYGSTWASCQPSGLRIYLTLSVNA